VQLLLTKIPKGQKDTDEFTVFLALFGSVLVKAAHKMLLKLTPVVPARTFAISSIAIVTTTRVSPFVVKLGKKEIPKRTNLFQSFQLLIATLMVSSVLMRQSLTFHCRREILR
jgi:hypothetical protein